MFITIVYPTMGSGYAEVFGSVDKPNLFFMLVFFPSVLLFWFFITIFGPTLLLVEFLVHDDRLGRFMHMLQGVFDGVRNRVNLMVPAFGYTYKSQMFILEFGFIIEFIVLFSVIVLLLKGEILVPICFMISLFSLLWEFGYKPSVYYKRTDCSEQGRAYERFLGTFVVQSGGRNTWYFAVKCVVAYVSSSIIYTHAIKPFFSYVSEYFRVAGHTMGNACWKLFNFLNNVNNTIQTIEQRVEQIKSLLVRFFTGQEVTDSEKLTLIEIKSAIHLAYYIFKGNYEGALSRATDFGITRSNQFATAIRSAKDFIVNNSAVTNTLYTTVVVCGVTYIVTEARRQEIIDEYESGKPIDCSFDEVCGDGVTLQSADFTSFLSKLWVNESAIVGLSSANVRDLNQQYQLLK